MALVEFGGLIVVLLALLWVDLHFFARGREATFAESVRWSIGWLVLGLAVAVCALWAAVRLRDLLALAALAAAVLLVGLVSLLLVRVRVLGYFLARFEMGLYHHHAAAARMSWRTLVADFGMN